MFISSSTPILHTIQCIAFYAVPLWHHQSFSSRSRKSRERHFHPNVTSSAANIITNSKPIIERGENVRAKSGCNRLDSRTELRAKQQGCCCCYDAFLCLRWSLLSISQAAAYFKDARYRHHALLNKLIVIFLKNI